MKHAEPTYPANHKPGMAVPVGGSMCANCKWLADAEKGLCGNEDFVKWNGSDVIPGAINAYCSDWYEPKKSAAKHKSISGLGSAA